MNLEMTVIERMRMKRRVLAILDSLPDDKWPCAIMIVSDAGHGYVPLVTADDEDAMEAVREVIIETAKDIVCGTPSD